MRLYVDVNDNGVVDGAGGTPDYLIITNTGDVPQSLDGVMVAVLAMLAITPFEAVAPLPSAFERLGRSLGATDRLFQVVDADSPTEPPASPQSVPPDRTLHVARAEVIAPGGARILGPIDLTIRPGTAIGVA